MIKVIDKDISDKNNALQISLDTVDDYADDSLQICFHQTILEFEQTTWHFSFDLNLEMMIA